MNTMNKVQTILKRPLIRTSSRYGNLFLLCLFIITLNGCLWTADAKKSADATILGKFESLDGECKVVAGEYVDKGFLTRKLHGSYCRNDCDFLARVECIDREIITYDPWAWWRNFTTGLDEEGEIQDEVQWEPIEADYGWELVWWLSGPSSTVLLLISASGLPNMWNTIVCVCYIVCTIFWYMSGDVMMMLHNVMYGLIFMNGEKVNRDAINHAIFGYVALVVSGILALATSNIMVNLLVAFGLLAMIGVSVLSGVQSKYQDRRTTFCLSCLQLMVFIRFTKYLIDVMAVRSLSFAILNISITGAMPHGPFWSLWSNFRYSLRDFRHLLDKRWRPHGTFFGFVLFWISFVIPRICIGLVINGIYRVGYIDNPILSGTLVYVCGVLPPIYYVISLLDVRNWNLPKVLASGFFLLITFLEMSYGVEFFAIRLTLSILVMGFEKGQEIFACYEIFCEAVVNVKPGNFPKGNSLPAVPIHAVLVLSDSIVEVTGSLVEQNVEMNTAIGTGILIGIQGNKSLLSVSHTFAGKNRLQIANGDSSDTIHVSNFESLGCGHDPPVVTRYNGSMTACGVPVMMRGETKFVSFLLVVHRDNMIVPVKEFGFDWSNGRLAMAVDLTYGDSGTPVFAVFRDGKIRLCAVVSKGVARYGGGNIAALITNGGSSVEQSINTAIDVTYGDNTDIYVKLRELLVEEREARAGFFSPNSPDDDASVSDHETEDSDEVLNEGDDEGNRPPNCPENNGKVKKPKNRVKSYRRNRAAEKRRSAFNTVLELARLPKQDADVIRSAFDEGKVVDFNRRRGLEAHGRAGLGFVPGHG